VSLARYVNGLRASPALPRSACCGRCRHFDNDARVLERDIAGLTTLGSGSAAVRDRDGICQLRQRYLAAHSRCEQFEPA